MVLGHVSQLTWEVLKDFWQINVTALTPLSSLSATEAQKEWEKAIHDLRKDGARPREVLSPYLPPYAPETEYLPLKTDKGVIMVTSLANFRSDYTVVCIPDGDFLAYQEKLYVNINLLRMGCSGRSALTLQEPRLVPPIFHRDN